MEWTDADFDQMSWHDSHVHAIRVEPDNPDHGTGILVLDLDYILEWIRAEDSTFRFRVVPAHLIFRGVFGLRIEIDWAAVSAGMIPFSIGRIDRKKIEFSPEHSSWAWTIEVDWPVGAITFQSPGYTQVSRGAAVLIDSQWLLPEQRSEARP